MKSEHVRKNGGKKFKILTVVLAVTTLLFGSALFYIVYGNFNYLAFKYLITGNYIYTDALGELYTEQIDVREEKDFFRNFDDVVIGVVTDKIRTINSDRYTYLYTPEEYTLQAETTKAVADDARIEELTAETVYLRLPNISVYTKDYLYANREALTKYKNIVIDLRSNSGGKLNDLYAMAKLFLDKGMVIGSEATRHSWTSRTVKASADRYFDFAEIILLQNDRTASAAEGFIMALKENLTNVTVIGTQSYGKGIGQVTIPLKHGYAVKATTLSVLTPSGRSIHGVGITPDILHETDEDMLHFALETLID